MWAGALGVAGERRQRNSARRKYLRAQSKELSRAVSEAPAGQDGPAYCLRSRETWRAMTRKQCNHSIAQGRGRVNTYRYQGGYPRLGATLSGVLQSGRIQALRPAKTPCCRLDKLLKRGAPQKWDAPVCSLIRSGWRRSLLCSLGH